MLLTIVGAGALVACGGGEAVGSVPCSGGPCGSVPGMLPDGGDAGDAAATTGDGGPETDAGHIIGVVPFPHDGGPPGVMVMPDASFD